MKYNPIMEYENAGGLNLKFSFLKIAYFIKQMATIYIINNDKKHKGFFLIKNMV